MINKLMLTKGVTCSKDKLDDILNAEEPNDESYHDKYNCGSNEFSQERK